MTEPCTCPLGADECDNGFGVFLPLQDGGYCAVRPCQKPAPARPQPTDNRRVRWDPCGVAPVDGARRLYGIRDPRNGAWQPLLYTDRDLAESTVRGYHFAGAGEVVELIPAAVATGANDQGENHG